MSDKEASPPRSRSRSRGSEVGSRKPSKSRSRSRSKSRGSYRSRSYKRSYTRSRTRSRSRGKRYKSRSRSPYHRSSRRRSSRRSRSRSRSHHRSSRRDSPDDSYYSRSRYRSRSPMSRRKRHVGQRDNPTTSRCVGVFGLSLYTQERDLREVFGRYGPIEEVQIVYDHQTGRSRGFSFIYYRNQEDAEEAKDRAPGTEIDGHKIRVDYSITQRAHTPTPGIYLGKPTSRYERSSGSGRKDEYHRRSSSPSYYSSSRRSSRYSRSRSRSYSPRVKKEMLENIEEPIYEYEERKYMKSVLEKNEE